MDYQRFLELAARFFERAGTVLHRKSEHYSGAEGSPACILIDETRSTYYLTEIGLPPDIPAHDSFLQKAVNEYATKHGADLYTVSLLAALGESLNTSKFRPVDDPAVDLTRLQQKGALIVAENAAAKLTDYLQKTGIEFQAVPLKGVFTIYFFNKPACEAIDRLFDEISGAEKSQEPEEEEAAMPPLMPEILTEEPAPVQMAEEVIAETQEIAPPGEELDSLLSKPYAGFSRKENEELVGSTLTEEVDYPPFHGDESEEEFSAGAEAADAVIKNTAEPETAAPAGKEHLKSAMESVYAPAAKLSRQSYGEPEDLAENTESFFYNVLKHIWSFIIYIPAYILLKATRGKVPQSIIYWISSICALFGAYYFPFAKGLAPITGAAKSAASGNLNAVSSMLGSLNPAAVFDGLTVPENLAGFVQSVANGAITLTAFDISLLSFVNSVYFLQYAIAFGLLLAVFPVCRKFGKRMVCFLVTAYFFYTPLLIVGTEGIKLLVLSCAGSLMGAAGSSAVAAICSAAAGSLALAFLIPAAACFLAAKVCKKDIDVL